jgi:hypothetical protein
MLVNMERNKKEKVKNYHLLIKDYCRKASGEWARWLHSSM